jgi:hypothetical protein
VLQLKGTRSNRDAIGAKLELTTLSGARQHQHVSTANGIYSASDKRVHFGLGSETAAARIEVQWPSGIRQVLNDVKADQILQVVEPDQ